jgi:hypothetical protein
MMGWGIKRIWAGMLVLLFLTGCSDKDNVPSGILSRSDMQDVLWDMAQADQYAAIYVSKDSARVDVKTETLKLYEQVFRLHQVSREEFEKSYKYYMGRPELVRGMLDSLVKRGNDIRMDSYKIPNMTPMATPAPVTPAVPARPAGMPPPGFRTPGMKMMPGPGGKFLPPGKRPLPVTDRQPGQKLPPPRKNN